MKKRYLLIIFLIISLLFGIYTSFIQKQQKQQTQTADQTLLQCLSEAGTCFGVDYTKMDEGNKIYNYMKASANLHTAIFILPYTSYADDKNNNQELVNALSGLYQIMTVQSTPKSTHRWIAVTEKEQAIFKCLHYISINPNDSNSCKALYKIANDIGIGE